MSAIHEALASSALLQHEPEVLAHESDLRALLQAGDNDAAQQLLQQLGIPKLGHRLRLVKQLAGLVGQTAVHAPSAVVPPAAPPTIATPAAAPPAPAPPAPAPPKPPPKQKPKQRAAAAVARSVGDVDRLAYERMPWAQLSKPADFQFGESVGRVYAHTRRALDEDRAPNSAGASDSGCDLSPGACVFPTAAQADVLAELFTSRGLVAVSIGAGEGFVEAQLEQRGVRVVAVDVDVLHDEPELYSRFGIFCTEVRASRASRRPTCHPSAHAHARSLNPQHG